ncbi:MAG: tRNA (N(6)-L-threonylcarbamoyladenosine(37)-C(2))-methylthiotransferase MtaB [Sphaerochaetaceae bacterium]
MRVSVFTLGCKLNQCESEAIADTFAKEGFEVVKNQQAADLVIVNSCTVTSKAEQKTRRMIRKFANEEHKPIVLVTGCYAQLEQEEIEKLSDSVVVVSLDDKPSLLKLPGFLAKYLVADFNLKEAVREFAALDKNNSNPFAYDAATFSFHSRAFLKIQDGCDNSCAFCRVTIARGDAISLDYPEVLSRALALQKDGFREIVLTGVNISAYKSDDYNLAKLIKLLLDNLDSSMRIRLSSLEPDRIDDELIETFKDSRIQSHFHIPIQSGSEAVLKRVNRHYDVNKLFDIVNALRSVKDDPFIGADIITGLPGETEEEFEKSFEILKALNLSQLHVFPFSARPQTDLFDAKDKVCERERDLRAQKLRNYSAYQYRQYAKRQIGKTVELLLEERGKNGWIGITDNYLKVELNTEELKFKKGDIVTVTIQAKSLSLLPSAKLVAS